MSATPTPRRSGQSSSAAASLALVGVQLAIPTPERPAVRLHAGEHVEERGEHREISVQPTLEAERAEVQKHLAWLEQRIKEFHAHNARSAAAAPARSAAVRLRGARARRATARSRQGNTKASIIEFFAQHPGSTAGDLAKGLNLNPGSVSTRLTQLAKEGEIKKASRGYSTK
jgi:Winged helix-turn-helix DNA-binding